MTLLVCSLSRLEETIRRREPSHVITLLSPGEMIPEHPRLGDRHLRVAVHDIVEALEGHTPPCAAMVEEILVFGRGWDGRRPLLVHCWAGVSRSSASAFIVACARNPHVPESQIAAAIRQASPAAHPNALLVELADQRLERGGRMIAAVRAIGPGRPVFENQPFEIPSVFPETGP